jgi:outer membrane protein OmpA-like peptidoglycan-associated protein
VTLGWVDFEGEQNFHDSVLTSVRLGYDMNDRWTVEGVLSLAPYIEANVLTDRAAPTWDSAQLVGVACDGLLHFSRWYQTDWYLSAGVGVNAYSENPTSGDKSDVVFRGGGGVMYHLNDEWALRADYRGMLAGFGGSPNANSIVEGGVVWTWGARVPPKTVAVGGSGDSDRDGLTDEEESRIGTDPLDPDTDRDRLRDGEEIKTYLTNPLNADTDWDLLIDGDEVYDFWTDPRDPDTDKGGVADGHEVREDNTDPRNGKDDHMLVELRIQFEYDKTVILPESFPQLDVIGKVLRRNVEATVLIEGHADKLKGSTARHNRRLSEQRAEAVVAYLAEKAQIGKKRMTAAGYGFDRPKYPNDPMLGNPLNRRVEIYIRGLTETQKEKEKQTVSDELKALPAPAPEAIK